MLDDRLKGKLKLYISGSQGVAPAENIVTYGIDFNTMNELINKFTTFIEENAYEYIDDYLEDCDYDEDDAKSMIKEQMKLQAQRITGRGGKY